MKRVCIRNRGNCWFGELPLTLGKVYNIVKVIKIPFNPHRPYDFSGNMFMVLNDEGNYSSYSEDVLRELTKEELREDKLNDLLNESI